MRVVGQTSRKRAFTHGKVPLGTLCVTATVAFYFTKHSLDYGPVWTAT